MMNAILSVGRLPAGDPKLAVEDCGVAAECAGLELLSLLVVLLWMGTFCFLLVGTLSAIPDARSLVRRERERTATEREAFDAFVRRVASLSISTPSASPGGVQVLAGAGDAADQDLERVREAYRDTVMSMDHYDAEYGEPLPENVAAEFSGEVATAITDGSALTPQVKQALVEGGKTARSEREEFLRTLDREREELDGAADVLGDAARTATEIRDRRLELRSYAELESTWRQLESLETDCNDCLDRRQESIHEGYTLGHRRGNRETFHTYLYDRLDETYPVLADGVRILESIRDAKLAVTGAITSRV